MQIIYANWIISFTNIFADTFDQTFIYPLVKMISAVAILSCVLMIIIGGYHYISSSGKPDALTHAKKIIKNSMIGLFIVLSASALMAILNHSYSIQNYHSSKNVPVISVIQPKPAGSGLVDVLIKAISGLLLSIVESVGAPFLKALDYFTTSTPMMASNSSVFHLWLTIVGVTDSLFVVLVCLVGLHVMSAAAIGIDEIDIKHLYPQIGFVFLLTNSSIFVIDGIIELSNAMIHAIGMFAPGVSVWSSLTAVTKQSGSLGIASLLIMLVFLILSIILLVYYVGRLVALYVGAILSPVICLIWLLPGYRDFAEAAARVYFATIFILFVHVVILQLAASLFESLVVGQSNPSPDPIMALIIGLATVVTLLKTQGLLNQWSYVGMGSRGIRRLGSQFLAASNTPTPLSSTVLAKNYDVRVPSRPAPIVRSSGVNFDTSISNNNVKNLGITKLNNDHINKPSENTGFNLQSRDNGINKMTPMGIQIKTQPVKLINSDRKK